MTKKTKMERSDYYQSVRGLRFLVRGYYDVQAARKVARSRNLPKATEMHVDEGVLAFLDADYRALHEREKRIGREIERYLKTMPVYREVFCQEKYRGLGYMMAAVILSENDITRQDTVSKMWAFAGLSTWPAERCVACHDVIENGKHRVNKKEAEGTFVCKETRTYSSSCAPHPVKGEPLRYNSQLRSKMYVLAGNLIKSGTDYACSECGAPARKSGDHVEESICEARDAIQVYNGPWRKIYDDYKHRKASAGWGMSDGHRHNAALRYTVKQLLREVWVDWRTFLGLSIREPYHVEKQGKPPHGGALAA